MPLILLFLWLLIHMCVVGTLSQNVVRGVKGQAVTLPCTYHVRQSGGLTDMCWGRGSCPNSKCNQEILRTNGKRVVSRTSSKYALRGSMTNGDVSLTIVNLNERDRGLYCCRIEIRGWFNDIKKTLSLQVETATTTAPTTTTAITTTTATITRQVVTSLITTAPLTTTVTHSKPYFPFLTTKPSYPSISNTTNSPTTATSSRSTATSFRSTTLQFVDIKSSPNTFQDKSTENSSRFFTIETASSATGATFVLSMSETTENSEISTSSGSTSALSMSETTENSEISTSPGLTLKSLDFSKKYYPVLIPWILVLGGVLLIVAKQLVKRKNMRKYQLGKMKSLIHEGEEPEQTPSETGENGMFPL